MKNDRGRRARARGPRGENEAGRLGSRLGWQARPIALLHVESTVSFSSGRYSRVSVFGLVGVGVGGGGSPPCFYYMYPVHVHVPRYTCRTFKDVLNNNTCFCVFKDVLTVPVI